MLAESLVDSELVSGVNSLVYGATAGQYRCLEG